jgi:hypothetical protein
MPLDRVPNRSLRLQRPPADARGRVGKQRQKKLSPVSAVGKGEKNAFVDLVIVPQILEVIELACPFCHQAAGSGSGTALAVASQIKLRSRSRLRLNFSALASDRRSDTGESAATRSCFASAAGEFIANLWVGRDTPPRGDIPSIACLTLNPVTPPAARQRGTNPLAWRCENNKPQQCDDEDACLDNRRCGIYRFASH